MPTLRARGGVMVGTEASPTDGANPATVNSSWFGKDKASTWAFIWFGLAVAWLTVMYFGHGGTRGSVI